MLALRAPRANRVFCADEKRIRTENAVMKLPRNNCLYRVDVLFIRAQSAIRADSFSPAQCGNSRARDALSPAD
jgi:hypothetical protein